MIAYVDASVVLRLVLRQQNALKELDKIDVGVTSGLAEVECVRTLDRLRLRGELSDGEVADAREAVLALFARMHVVDVGPAVLRRAAMPMPTQLGTLDAIHLATALLWSESSRERPTMATHDIALGVAARAHGLPVLGT